MPKPRKIAIPGLSFSWKRAVGITQAKQKIARQIGIPLSKQGRQRKMGKAVGCLVPILFVSATLMTGTAWLMSLLSNA